MRNEGICLYCGNPWIYYRSQSCGKFCSLLCSSDYKVEQRLRKNTSFDRAIRNWCYRHLEQKCFVCGLGTEWNKKPLRLQVDHKDGDVHNNERENFRMICPNCHTQTDNWGVRNASEEGRKRMVEGVAKLRALKCGGIV